MANDNQIIKSLQTTLGQMEIALGTIHEAILWTNRDGDILWCNKSFDKLLDCPHIKLLGASVFDVFPLEKEDQRLSSEQHPCRFLPKMTPFTDNIYVYKRKDESITLEISSNRIDLGLDNSNVILSIRNVTALLLSREDLKKAKSNLEATVKQRTKELQRISDKHRNIVFQAVDAIITINNRGIIQSFNPAAEKMFGFTEKEIIEKNVNILMPSPHQENHDQFLRNYLTSGTKKIIGIGREVIGMRRDGQLFPLDLAVSETRTDNSIFFTGILRDRSERKEAEAVLEKAKLEAEQASRIKSDFLARMSHEIRTPMNAILGMAELLQDTDLSSEQQQYIDTFQGAGQHLLSIINDLLDHGKIESDQFKLETVAFDLHKLFSETYELMVATADKKEISLKCTIAPETPKQMRGDPIRLKQVLINIIGNAIKFTDKGEVSFHVSREAAAINENKSSKRVKLLFEISDTGSGIKKEALETIFDTFTQGDQSITRKFSGTGLGLSISRKLVRQMDGDISVSSKLHQGTTITFSAWFLTADRIEENALADMALSATEDGTYTPSGPVSILLAEDSADNRLLFKLFLKDLDCSLDFAENGKIAFEKFKSSNYSLVLMDVQMPVLDGYSATKLIRSHENKNNLVRTPVIALTAHALEAEKEKSQQAGCDLHLTKPISKKKLLAAICGLLSKSSHQKNGPGSNKKQENIVHIDKLIEDLIPGFLENRRNDIDALRQAVDKDDMTTIEGLAHTMKGTGGGYGFQKITELGDALERAARQRDLDSILKLVKELEIYLDTLEVVIVE